jgi:hypothetical protein
VRYFTPEEANAALADVRPLAERLVQANAALRRAHERLAQVRSKVAGNGGGMDAGRTAELAEEAGERAAEVAETIDELTGLGVQVKDLDSGLVDFPARRADGETVLLCWRLGEEEIAYWHGLEEGFAGRKPLPL